MSYSIFEIPKNIQVWIFFILLVCLSLMSIVFFVTNEDSTMEGLVNAGPIRYDNIVTFEPNKLPIKNGIVDMSANDIANGYYYIQNSVSPSGNIKVKMPFGYYKVDDNTMAQIPNGYMLERQGTDPTVDYTKIIVPKTNAAIYASGNPNNYDPNSKFFAEAKPHMRAPLNGSVPDGMYLLPEDPTKMAILPPDMKPNIDTIDIGGIGLTGKLVVLPTYSKTRGYISESEYYKKVFTINTTNFVKRAKPTDDASPLPPELYYDASLVVGYKGDDPIWAGNANPLADRVRFLPYGKVPNTDSQNKILPGFKPTPGMISNAGDFKYDQTYKDILSNPNVEFHGNVATLQDRNEMNNAEFGSMTVLDKSGNLITIPRSSVQGDITYFQPSTFKYGLSTYVPKYEDSVYLSRTSHMPTMAEYRSAFKTVGFCEEHKDSPFALEEKCGALSAETCASTSCCVLLGGAKCVSGNENGPSMKQNYGDVFVRNKDYYTHLGKCYGNCP
jgi:hypothetical protein